MKALLEAIRAASIAVWDYDVPSGRVCLSEEWRQLLGDAEARLDTTMPELAMRVPEFDRPRALEVLKDALAGRRDAYSVEHRYVHAGRTIWLLSVGRVVERDAQGRALRLVGTNTDVSALKEAEEEARASLAQRELVLDHSPAYIVYVDRELVIRFHNKAYERIVGAGGDIDGRHVLEVFGPDSFGHAKHDIYKVLAGDTVEIQRRQRLADGTVIDLAGQYVPHRNAAGEVLGFISTLSDVSALKRAEERLLALAATDVMTGLANRRSFEERLATSIGLARRQGFKVALLYIDLDRFKPVNDSHGHAAGDRVLFEIAARLKAASRESDLVARIGGDEFALILNGVADEKSVARSAERVRLEIQRPIDLGGPVVSVDASMGIAVFPDDADSDDFLLRRADDAMYAAKASGAGIRLYRDMAVRAKARSA